MIRGASSTTQNPFLGEWRIVEMAQWDRDYIDMVVPGHFTFERGGHGSFQFGVVDGGLDCRLVSSSEGPRVEFTWEGFSEMDQVSGRGWATLRNGEIVGHLYFHAGDDSSFRAVPKRKRALTARPTRTRRKRSATDNHRARRAGGRGR